MKLRLLAFVVVMALCTHGAFTKTADDYRTGTADPLIVRMPSSVTSYKSKGAETYLEKVAEYIANNAVDDFDKVKKLHDWTALNIRYNTGAFFSGRIPDQTVSNVISSGQAVCAGYSEVFLHLCKLLDIECETVTGYARGYGRSVFGSENPYNSSHAWNKVRINGDWYLIDTTWDAGYVNGRSYVARYRTDYLFPPPEQYIHDHFPGNSADQFLTVPLPAEDFVNLPMVRPVFFSQVTELSPVMQKITKVKGRFFRIDFTSKYYFMFHLSSPSGRGENNNLSSSRRSGKMTVYLSFNRPGNSEMELFSSPTGTGTHDGIGEFGFNVEIPEVKWGEIPGDAELLFPEVQELAKNTQIDFKVKPGKWKYLVLIRNNSWQYLSPDDDGIFTIKYNTYSAGTFYLAGSETESGMYETLAEFKVN